MGQNEREEFSYLVFASLTEEEKVDFGTLHPEHRKLISWLDQGQGNCEWEGVAR